MIAENFFFLFSIPAEKSAAFEEFRRTRGANLNRIYLENKETVGAKKKQFAELARRVNQTKSDIDRTRMEAERKKNERLTMGKTKRTESPVDFRVSFSPGEFLNENGETIIDEEEFRFISKLQELKGIYRSNYDQWKNLKSELSYSQNLLNQYQNRLLQGETKRRKVSSSTVENFRFFVSIRIRRLVQRTKSVR